MGSTPAVERRLHTTRFHTSSSVCKSQGRHDGHHIKDVLRDELELVRLYA
jgi:hypothetical protein